MKQTGDIHPVLYQCWANVVDGGPALLQQWVNVLLLLVTGQPLYYAGPTSNSLALHYANTQPMFVVERVTRDQRAAHVIRSRDHQFYRKKLKDFDERTYCIS